MENVNRTFAKTFKEQILQNKMLLVITVFVAVLSYGFTFCNFSIGIDDPAAYYYLHTTGGGSMVQQGRLLHVLLEFLTGCVDFIPFFNEFLGVALFLLSSWVLCAVFQYITNNAFSGKSLTVFSCIYISFPIIHEKFIYSIDVIPVMLSYLCFAFSLLYSYQLIFEKRRIAALYAIIHLIFSIASYESFIFLYVGGVFFLFILEIVVNKNEIKLKSFITKGLAFVGILVVSIVIYYSIVVVVQLATNQYGIFERGSSFPKNASIFGIIYEMVIVPLPEILISFMNVKYLPFLIFDILSILCFIFAIAFSFTRKSIIPFISFSGLLTSNFLIFLVVGWLMQRAAQSLSFFVAAILLILLYSVEKLNKKSIKSLLYCAAALLIFVQSANLSLYFYNDYSRYKKEEFAINSIATRLIGECDIEKPVVFVGPNRWSIAKKNYLNSINDQFATNGESAIMNHMVYVTNTEISRLQHLFEMHGYDFIKAPTEEQAKAGADKAKEMEAWPHKDSIKEFEDYIVVNFGCSEEE